MKRIYKLVTIFLALGTMCSCQKSIDKVDVWPEWPAPANVAINGASLDQMFYETYKGIEMDLTQGQTVTFSGLSKLRTVLQSHYWEVLSETEAKFLGFDGTYDIIWDNESSCLFTEPLEKGWVFCCSNQLELPSLYCGFVVSLCSEVMTSLPSFSDTASFT